MNALRTHLALTAAQTGRAQPRATCRHSHLSDRSLVVVGYHLAGDIGAPLALVWGTDPANPQVVVVPEPRNRALRFAALERFGTDLVRYLDGFAAQSSQTRGARGRPRDQNVCDDAPQLVLANPATADWLFGIVGRFTRNLRTDGDPPAPPVVPTAGKHLSFFEDRLPGSSLVLTATELLTTHWQTGQLPAEDLNLAALLAWVDPPPGISGPQAAAAAEDRSPAGPISDPHWDARVLEPLIQDWHRATTDADRERIRRRLTDQAADQLQTAWEGSWRSLELLAALPPAAHLPRRWLKDREAWTAHRDRVADGTARFRRIPTPVQAAQRLRRLEQRTAELAYQMAHDDLLVLAADAAGGEALVAEVVTVEATHRVATTTGRSVLRPRLTLNPLIPYNRPVGIVGRLTADPRVAVQVVQNDEDGCRALVTSGANQTTTANRLPAPGDVLWLNTREQPRGEPPPQWPDTPWTHTLPAAEEQP